MAPSPCGNVLEPAESWHPSVRTFHPSGTLEFNASERHEYVQFGAGGRAGIAQIDLGASKHGPDLRGTERAAIGANRP